MTRSKRLAPAGRVIDERERQQAEQLALSEKRVAESEAKLAELERYYADYAREFAIKAGKGTGVSSLRDYQTFLARLTQAVSQQTGLLLSVRQERDAELVRWQQAARHAKAVGNVMERWRSEEHYAEEKRDQRESDERAQRTPGSRGSL
jgi:flagellar protein FliJ